MSVLLKGQNISKSYGTVKLIEHSMFEIFEGERVGLVGRNGCGKSTLLGMMTGEIMPSEGQWTWYKSCEIGYLRQVAEPSILTSSLSGGEQTKKRLQEILYQKHDFLILDEPTNHLDRDAIKWLIKTLKKEKATLLIVSHDRYFLDQCTDRIVEIEAGTLTSYKGNYSAYREEKQRQYESKLHAYEVQEKRKQKLEAEMKQLQAWSSKAHNEAAIKARKTGNKFGGKEHNRAKAKKRDQQVKSKLKRLMRMEETGLQKPKEVQKITLDLNEWGKGNRRVIEAKEIRKAFNGKVLFDDSSFYINKGEKIGVYGPNGCGKSTLIKALLGIESVEGDLFLSQSAHVGYMSQDESLGLDENRDVQAYLGAFDSQSIMQAREKLDQMGFKKECFNQPLFKLSQGECMKLKLLKMILEACNVLILDEPTNHMDLQVRETLEEVLQSYEGTCILITHDAYMMERLCPRLLVFEKQKIKRFEGSLSQYEGLEKEEQQHKHVKQQLMRIELELARLISLLSQLTPNDAAYQELDALYQSLLAEKKQLLD